MKQIFFSIIIPCRSLSNYLTDECLPAINKQICRNFETIVLPDNKSPQDKKLLLRYHWLKIVPTKKVTRPAEKRDLGAKIAKGQILAFIDDDAYPDKNWLSNSFIFLKKKNVGVICGPGILPKKTNLWEKVFDEILKSRIGSGEHVYRFFPQKQKYVDDYPSMNFLIKKNIFEKLGGFNSNYWPGEDSKLCEDLVYKENKKILYVPSVLVYHHRRTNLKGFIKQHSQYGFHRGAFFGHGDKNSRRISYLVPTLFVLYLLFLFPLLLITNYLLLITFPMILYFFLLFYLFAKVFLNTKNLAVSFLAPLILFITHITYGIMFINGFFTGILKGKNIYEK